MIGNKDVHQVCSTRVFIYAFVSLVCTCTEAKQHKVCSGFHVFQQS